MQHDKKGGDKKSDKKKSKKKSKREGETPEERAARKAEKKKKRENETPEERAARKAKKKQKKEKKGKNEEPVLDSLAPMRAEMQKRKAAEEEALKKNSDSLTPSVMEETNTEKDKSSNLDDDFIAKYKKINDARSSEYKPKLESDSSSSIDDKDKKEKHKHHHHHHDGTHKKGKHHHHHDGTHKKGKHHHHHHERKDKEGNPLRPIDKEAGEHYVKHHHGKPNEYYSIEVYGPKLKDRKGNELRKLKDGEHYRKHSDGTFSIKKDKTSSISMERQSSPATPLTYSLDAEDDTEVTPSEQTTTKESVTEEVNNAKHPPKTKTT